MLSLEPATLGEDGYREIFQVGETLDGMPLIDRQHPHDFLMQAAVVWRTPLGRGYSLTLAGAPVGEPALGPVAFMHRSSAFENPTAPLSHHTVDSTHISMGVLTAGLDRGPWQVEGSLFHGGEPDEQRWDLMDPGVLDSWSVRGWYRPTSAWTLQASHGFLKTPEAHEPGDVRRTSASASWIRRHARGWTAATAIYGRNNKLGGDFNAFLAEATHTFGANSVYGRFESLQVETDVLRFGDHTFVGSSKILAHAARSGKRRGPRPAEHADTRCRPDAREAAGLGPWRRRGCHVLRRADGTATVLRRQPRVVSRLRQRPSAGADGEA